MVERKDGSLYLLLRTESGWLCEATSRDGLKWEGLKQSHDQVRHLLPADGAAERRAHRPALESPPRHDPKSGSAARSCPSPSRDDERHAGRRRSSSRPTTRRGGRVSYPYLYERKPGELWITTMQGGLRMKINVADLGDRRDPRLQAAAVPEPKPGGIIMFGDSTTAPRGAVKKVYAVAWTRRCKASAPASGRPQCRRRRQHHARCAQAFRAGRARAQAAHRRHPVRHQRRRRRCVEEAARHRAARAVGRVSTQTSAR